MTAQALSSGKRFGASRYGCRTAVQVDAGRNDGGRTDRGCEAAVSVLVSAGGRNAGMALGSEDAGQGVSIEFANRLFLVWARKSTL